MKKKLSAIAVTGLLMICGALLSGCVYHSGLASDETDIYGNLAECATSQTATRDYDDGVTMQTVKTVKYCAPASRSRKAKPASKDN
jgi:hypothetical protein